MRNSWILALLLGAGIAATATMPPWGLNQSPGALAQKATATVDAARIAGAKDMMAAAGVSKQFDTVMPLIFNQMKGLFLQQHPTQQKPLSEIFDGLLVRMSARKQELIDEIAVLYAQKLTVEEMKEITRFYSTGAGAKFIQLQPELAGQSAAIGQRWGQKLGAEVEQEVRREAKKRGMEL
jgi:uncharacterized protein